MQLSAVQNIVKDLVNDWDSQPTILSVIAETQPKVAYLARAAEKGGEQGVAPALYKLIRIYSESLADTSRIKM